MKRLDEIKKNYELGVYEGNVYTNIAEDMSFMLGQLETASKTLESVLSIFDIQETYAKVMDHNGNKHYLFDDDFEKVKSARTIVYRKEEMK